MNKQIPEENSLIARLASYAATAGALTLISSAAQGQIAYSGYADIELDMGDALELDLDTNGVTDFNLLLSGNSGYSSNTYLYMRRRFGFGVILNARSSLYANSWVVRKTNITYSADSILTVPILSGMSMEDPINEDVSSWSNRVSPYWEAAFGVDSLVSIINSTSSYYKALQEGDFIGKTRFAGVRFYIGADQHYGWIRVSMDDYLVPMRIIDWAYEQTPGVGITAGAGGESTGPVISFVGFDERTPFQTINLTLTMDETGEGLEPDDIEVSNGSLVSLTPVMLNKTYLLEVEAADYGDVSVSVREGAVTDTYGNSNELASAAWHYYNATSLNLAEIDRLNIYPNPVQQELNVEFEAEAVISLLDLHGRIHYQSDMVDKHTIDVSAYAPGMYVLQINHSGEMIRKRIVIQ